MLEVDPLNDKILMLTNIYTGEIILMCDQITIYKTTVKPYFTVYNYMLLRNELKKYADTWKNGIFNPSHLKIA